MAHSVSDRASAVQTYLATILVFYSVGHWNEWFYAMIFIRKNSIIL